LGPNLGIITDQIVARLGVEVGAPVGQPKIVIVPQELIEIDPGLWGFIAGTAHATQHISDCFDGFFDHAESLENRPRFVLFALLYGWCVSGDHQFLYEKQEPHFVHSVDHGHFLPGSTSWNVTTLRATLDVNIDPHVQ
jgi:hypothetical protein